MDGPLFNFLHWNSFQFIKSLLALKLLIRSEDALFQNTVPSHLQIEIISEGKFWFLYSEIPNKPACYLRFLRFFFLPYWQTFCLGSFKFKIPKSVLDFQKKSSILISSGLLFYEFSKEMSVSSFIRDFRVIDFKLKISLWHSKKFS